MPYSMQLTEQIPNDTPRMGAKSTTISNHPINREKKEGEEAPGHNYLPL